MTHFDLFRNQQFRSFNICDPDPGTCDLKVYQDYLVYLFIRNNLPPGARLLEVGGGYSRVLPFFSDAYECWNVDKCEGLGNGPVQFSSPHYRIVYDYMGNRNPELPDAYFDCVFSISALEHSPEDQQVRENIYADIQRVLKPGGHSLHCFDIVFDRPFGHWVNGLIPYFYSKPGMKTQFTKPEDMLKDPDCYIMSKPAYENGWARYIGKSYEEFGRPASVNVYWQK